MVCLSSAVSARRRAAQLAADRRAHKPGGTHGMNAAQSATGQINPAHDWSPFTSFQLRRVQRSLAYLAGDVTLELMLQNNHIVSPKQELDNLLNMFDRLNQCQSIMKNTPAHGVAAFIRTGSTAQIQSNDPTLTVFNRDTYRIQSL